MTKEVTLVFPHHLFKDHPGLSKDRDVVLVEEWLFFSQYRFHRQKLMLHRASMKAYEDSLRGQGFKPLYIEASDARHDVRELVAHLSSAGVKTVHTAEAVDDWLSRRLLSEAERKGIRVVSHPAPLFIENKKDIDAWFEGRNRYFQTDFYVWQRKKRGILIDAEGKLRDLSGVVPDIGPAQLAPRALATSTASTCSTRMARNWQPPSSIWSSPAPNVPC
jgi:deoxyribodipyrimidine photolyase-related protein